MLNIIGQIFGTTGYDIHCRELSNALGKITDCSLTVPVVPDWYRHVNDLELEMIKKKNDDDINLIITNPNFWRMHTTAKRNWAYLVWEGDKIPECWIDECMNPDIEYIFVPSEHTKQAILNTEYPDNLATGAHNVAMGHMALTECWTNKIKVIPHGVDLKKFYPQQKKAFAMSGSNAESDDLSLTTGNKSVGTFTFLANKGFRNMEDRGGVQYLIKAYLDEFTKSDNVELVVKVNPAYGFNPDIMKNFKMDETSPIITILTDAMEYKDLVNLYNKCNVFVAPSRAEAFNIPCLEAMACAKPVITTNFGGQTDFCSDETGWIIGGEMTEVDFDLQYEGISWLTPDIKQLREALRGAYDEHKDYMKVLGDTALNTAKLLTWDRTAELIEGFK